MRIPNTLCIVVLAGDATIFTCLGQWGNGCPWFLLNSFLVVKCPPSRLKVTRKVFILLGRTLLTQTRQLLLVLHSDIWVCITIPTLPLGPKVSPEVQLWNTIVCMVVDLLPRATHTRFDRQRRAKPETLLSITIEVKRGLSLSRDPMHPPSRVMETIVTGLLSYP